MFVLQLVFPHKKDKINTNKNTFSTLHYGHGLFKNINTHLSNIKTSDPCVPEHPHENLTP